MKINVGCGWEVREGWINVDNTQKPQRANYPIEFMDATVRWNYEDNTFDAVLSEHMIEHLPEEKGEMFLSEAYRTLKPYGVIRVTCPDRGFLEKLLADKDDNHPFVVNYCRQYMNASSVNRAERVVYRSLHQQGHVWVPYANQLIEKMENAGFVHVSRVQYGTSNYEVFDCIEKNNGIREYETLCVEGIKIV